MILGTIFVLKCQNYCEINESSVSETRYQNHPLAEVFLIEK